MLSDLVHVVPAAILVGRPAEQELVGTLHELVIGPELAERGLLDRRIPLTIAAVPPPREPVTKLRRGQESQEEGLQVNTHVAEYRLRAIAHMLRDPAWTDRPIGENTTADGRANNRRVEIIVSPPERK